MDPRNQAPSTFLEVLADRGIKETQARRILSEVLARGNCDPGDWAEKGILSKTALERHFTPLPRLRLEKVQVSPVDGFQKLLLRTHDGLAIETVIIPLHKEGMNSICLSSQVGCVMGCVFCATGRMSSRRNLETWEIIDQFLHAREIVRAAGRRISGAVFMGMGEPFLNYERVLAAAKLLSFPTADAISSKAITISTVGHVREIDRFTEEGHRFRLSISLGAASDEKRAFLVPVAAKTPVAEVMAAARRHALSRGDRINLSYVCIAGINVGEDDAKALADLIGETPVRLDIIDVSDPTGRFQAPSDSELKGFRDALSKYLKQPVVRRYSGGADIQAACGTLAGDQSEPMLGV